MIEKTADSASPCHSFSECQAMLKTPNQFSHERYNVERSRCTASAARSADWSAPSMKDRHSLAVSDPAK
jgi:hypothetical protein